ncbi:ArnT family glycosyltransferase [Terriglobus roseus]|uniref:Dolichyl-phosphate-mannose-protein mannosyltransferase n=1 Tax=Terriglobus roseus TaxID=392734 RepID=A0A1H4KGU7_9BACT|nr:glycosyltransferase family 39 protein [Terriglobus roseus]SEB57769.1 Dolichyl-phosphate-mannose-protein mannosyltransferase [Terriglobus roseus]
MTAAAAAETTGPDTNVSLPKPDALTRAIQSTPWRAFLALTALYVVAVAALSHLKLLWLDEFITLHVARLDNVKAIWQALTLGADPNPPVTHLLVHFCRALFGEREFALRLPAMIGYWIGLVSLFTYLRRRVPAEWALAGTVLSMAMAAFEYSYESRSYGIFYGLTMLAFLGWCRATETTRPQALRVIWLVVMTVSLGAGISTNYFAVLAFVPITAGEIARTLERIAKARKADIRSNLLRSINWPTWLALALAISPLLVYLPLINRAIAQFAPHAWNKVSLDQVFDSYTQMVEMILYPLLALFTVAAVKHFMQVSSPEKQERRIAALSDSGIPHRILPLHELVGVFCLMLYPFLGYTMASVRGGMLSPRFVIPVCFGFAIGGTVTAYRLASRRRYAGPVFLCFVLAWFIARESVVGYWYAEQKQSFYKVVDRLPLAFDGLPTNTPLAIPDPLMALTFQRYAPSEYVRREVFPIDFPAVRKFRNDDSPEQNLWAARSMYSLKIVPLATFQSTAGQYVILASDWNWLLQDLNRHHYREQRLPINTRAGAIGGFTPLSHGLPAFYIAEGDAMTTDSRPSSPQPSPFQWSDELPEAPDLP